MLWAVIFFSVHSLLFIFLLPSLCVSSIIRSLLGSLWEILLSESDSTRTLREWNAVSESRWMRRCNHRACEGGDAFTVARDFIFFCSIFSPFSIGDLFTRNLSRELLLRVTWRTSKWLGRRYHFLLLGWGVKLSSSAIKSVALRLSKCHTRRLATGYYISSATLPPSAQPSSVFVQFVSRAKKLFNYSGDDVH